MNKRMRSDLAAEGVSIPARNGPCFDSNITYLEASDLEGAKYSSTWHPYIRLKLKDERYFYFVEADVENEE
jgi:hypothetical protein